MDIKQILESNNNLNNETKKMILLTIKNIAKQGYNVPLENIKNKLSTLTIEQGNLDNQVIAYKDNKIIIDSKQIKYYDQKLALTSIIIEMLRKYPDKGKITEPISLGFNESFSITLCGIDGFARYEEEQVINRMLSKIIGDSEMIKLYFEEDMSKELPLALLKSGCKEDDIEELLDMIYKNYKSKEIR